MYQKELFDFIFFKDRQVDIHKIKNIHNDFKMLL